MKLIAVLCWIDGFGEDTYVYGVFDSLENARNVVPKQINDHEPRYEIITLNKTCADLDWYGAKPLFPNNNKKRGK
jgi:hypothetical protein